MRKKSTVIRDFGGGWNVVDDDLNLSPSFQTILDNVHRGIDNALSVRWGTALFVKLRNGTVTNYNQSVTISWTNGSHSVNIAWAGHPFLDGEHFTLTSSPVLTGLNASEIINHPHGVRKVDANNFRIVVRTAASANGSVGPSAQTFTRDSHALAGDVVEMTYYSDHLIVVDSAGEIVKINAAKTITRIWDISKAILLAGAPEGWMPITYASSDIFKGELLVVNGKDKPLLINLANTPNVQYLQDIPTGTNVNTPIARYVRAIGKWVVMAGDPAFPYRLHISSTNTSGTWLGDPAPNDAVQLDLNNTNSSSIFIRGINLFRDFLAVAFDDTVTMVELGNFNGSTHDPNVTDTIARHGAISHKSMLFLGFDLLMADPIGIPSFAKSQFDSSIIPSRMSEFIAPAIQRNINRLGATTLQDRVFAIYSTHDNRYILFMQNYDNDVVTLPLDPVYNLETNLGTDVVLLNIPNHGMDEGDTFTLSGVVGAPYPIPSPCTVNTVINEDFISFKLASPNVVPSASQYGGSTVTITRTFTETPAFALTYNKNLRIKAWSRYRGWNFRAGTTSLYGRVFLATTDKIYRMGNRFEPIYADFVGDYDDVWANSTAYVVGNRELDNTNNQVYICLQAHTSPGGPTTFATDRANNPDRWDEYQGEYINFQFELPWADFDKRDLSKTMKTLNVDAKGSAEFTVQMFVDYFYKDKLSGIKTPLLSMDMVGGDIGAFGAGEQNFGTGRVAIRQRPWPFEAKGKLFKLRIQGQAKKALRFSAFIFSYIITGRQR